MEPHQPDPGAMSGRKVVLVGLAILTIIVIVPAVIVAIAIGRAASSLGERPALARDILAQTPSALSSQFRDRVERRFPVGMPETALLAELRSEGFVIKRPHLALFKRGGVCRNEWQIGWEAIDGTVTTITGSTLDPPHCL